MPIGGKDAFLSKVTLRRELRWYCKTKQELKDMKSIVERAKEYASTYIVNITGYRRCTIEGYLAGATEQKEIDTKEFMEESLKMLKAERERVKAEIIDKACEWLINTYLGDYVTDEYGNGGIGDNVNLAEDFRKAMEE